MNNLFSDIPAFQADELIEVLADSGAVRIERGKPQEERFVLLALRQLVELSEDGVPTGIVRLQ